MANRVSDSEVKEIIDTTVTTTPFIDAANLIVTSKLADQELGDALLKEIERWLSAHLVAIRDPMIKKDKTGEAEVTYVTGKEGMGFGDFKLLALFGAWLGWQYLPLILILSSLVGAVVGTTMIFLVKRDRNLPIPFGPYLAAAGWIALLWGNQINQLYLNYAGL